MCDTWIVHIIILQLVCLISPDKIAFPHVNNENLGNISMYPYLAIRSLLIVMSTVYYLILYSCAALRILDILFDWWQLKTNKKIVKKYENYLFQLLQCEANCVIKLLYININVISPFYVFLSFQFANWHLDKLCRLFLNPLMSTWTSSFNYFDC